MIPCYRLGDEGTAAVVQICLGRCAYDTGSYQEARSLLETALATHRRLRSPAQQALALYCLGDLELRCGKAKPAQDHYCESLTIMHEIGNKTHSTRILFAFTRLAQWEGRLERTAHLLGAIAALMNDIGMKVISMEPTEHEEHEQLITSTRAALGEDVFIIHWTAGSAESWKEAVEFALEQQLSL